MSPELLQLLHAVRELGAPGAAAVGVALVAWAELRLLPRLRGPAELLRAVARHVGLSDEAIRTAEGGPSRAARQAGT